MKLKQLASATSLAVGMALTAPTMVGAAEHKVDAMKNDSYTPSSVQSGRPDASAKMAGETLTKPAGEFDGIHVVNNTGDKIGEIQSIVKDKANGRLQAVVEVGGFLGIGEKEVTIPVDQLRVRGEGLLAPVASTEDELKARAEYKEDMYAELPDEQLVKVDGGADASAMAATQASRDSSSDAGRGGFGSMDANRDGYLSKDEAAKGMDVYNWKVIDRNKDGLIDQSEFSAFEIKDSTMSPRGLASPADKDTSDAGAPGSDVPQRMQQTPSSSDKGRSGY